ncbi:hypothetical protein F4775DRAFT_101168 [Biscogniauxia sp. FL1348]|nr:hypothetical protein F4775DRAFT_101168 [Biscogniauxia sp. FL1348]
MHDLSADSFFAFTVEKTWTTMKIAIHDQALIADLMAALSTKPEELRSTGEFDGLALLKSRHTLAEYLQRMQHGFLGELMLSCRIALFSLLVDGLLDDAEVFKSYDFMWLYHRGYLDIDRWEWYSGFNRTINHQISHIEQAYLDGGSFGDHDYVDNPENRFPASVQPGPVPPCLTSRTPNVSTRRTLPQLRPRYCSSSFSKETGFIDRPLKKSVSSDARFHQSGLDSGQLDVPMCPAEQSDFYEFQSRDSTPSVPGRPVSKNPSLTPKLDHNRSLISILSNDDCKDLIQALEKAMQLFHNVSVSSMPGKQRLLLGATINGNITMVQNLFRQSTSPRTTRSFSIDNDICQDQTCHYSSLVLLAAVHRGHIRIAKLLLRHGYDANCALLGETPLSIAARYSSDSLIRLLLSYGGDVPTATLVLRKDISLMDNLEAATRLGTLAGSFTSHNAQKRSIASRNAIKLRNSFWKEHTLMSEAASKALEGIQPQNLKQKMGMPYISAPNTSWASHFVWGCREAWRLGFKVLRGLCNGKTPGDVNEALLFLGLSKSMATVVDGEGFQDLQREFFDDLSRWQIVFPEGTSDHLAFIDATKAIWGIDIKQCRQPPPQNHDAFVEALQRLQDLTLRLVSQVGSVVGISGVGDLSLAETQARWRSRRKCQGPTGLILCKGKIQHQDTDHRPESRSTTKAGIKGINELPKADETSGNLGSNNGPDPILTLILAGTIFAIVLLFFLLSQNPACRAGIQCLLARSGHETPVYEQTRLVLRTTKLLQMYLAIKYPSSHMIHTNTDQKLNNESDEFTMSSSLGGSSQPAASTSQVGNCPTNMWTESGSTLSLAGSRNLRSSSTRPPKKTFCDDCKHDFGTTSNYGKHRRDRHETVRYACCSPKCNRTFQRNDTLLKHQRRRHLAKL